MPLNSNIPLSIRPFELESPLAQAQQALTLSGLIDQQRQRQRAVQEESVLKGVMQQTGGDPQKAIQALLSHGTLGAIGLAAKLDGLIKKPDAGFTLSPGAVRYGPSGKVIAQAPAAPEKPEASPEIVKLLKMAESLPAGSPMRAALERRGGR